MTQFDWKILETVIDDGALLAVKYRCKASDNQNTVETEGNWTMLTPHQIDQNTSEHLVAHWLELDTTQTTRHLIKSRLQEQLDALKSNNTTRPPWAVDTFKVTI
jgi:hypothetical protein